MKVEQVKTIIRTNCNSKARKYLLSGDDVAKTLFDKIANTVVLLANLTVDEKVVINGISYDIDEYQMPNSKLKTAIENNVVYWNSGSVSFKLPIIKAVNEIPDGNFATPSEFKKFFSEYSSFKINGGDLSKVTKNSELTISDIHSFRCSDQTSGIVLNGGALIDEKICYLNQYQFQLPLNLHPFIRNTSWDEDEGDDSKFIDFI